MTTGERIKRARKEAGLTQKALGERMGVAPQTIAQWENNLRNPKSETLQKIADALSGGSEPGARKWSDALSKHGLPVINGYLPIEEEGLFQDVINSSSPNQARQKVHAFNSLDEDSRQLLNEFFKLNSDGKHAAIERLKEMVEHPWYKKTPPKDEELDEETEGEIEKDWYKDENE